MSGQRYAIEVEDVVFRYPGGVSALDAVSVTWPAPGVVALLGPNGAGKSTLLSLLVGLRRPQSGRISTPPGRQGFVAQDAVWPGRFKVRELLEYAAWWQEVPRSARAERIRVAANSLDLEKVMDQRLARLSGGLRHRAMIAQALVSDPAVLVLDEPSSGLDPRQRVGLREQIAKLAEQRIVIVATHLVDDVEKIADWVTVLDEGEVRYTGPIEDVTDRRHDPQLGALEAIYLDSTS